MYAVNSESSFSLVNEILKDIKQLGNDRAPKLIVGNFRNSDFSGSDVSNYYSVDDESRTVPITSLKSLAESLENCQYTEVSAV